MADTDKSLYSLRYNQISSNLEAFGGGSPQWTVITLNNVDPQQVPITRLINTTAPLQGGGNLTVDRTLSITQASGSVDGYLSSVDWTTFNAKQPAGSYITSLTGDATAAGPGSAPLTLATVNGTVGTFTYASVTVNAKGLVTSASNGIVGSLTDVGTDGITVTGGTGAVIGAGTSLSQHVADSTHNGYLSSVDWSTFNSKQAALTFGNLTDVGTDGITVTGGTGAVIGTGTSLSQHVADSTHNGYLSSTDWTTFNGKQAAGNYITALTGDVTATGPGSVAATLATVNANVGSFTYSSITVNAKGLITAASSGTAPVTSVSGTAGDISSTGGTTPVLDLVNTAVTPGTYTYTTLTVDAKGRLTAASSGTAPVTSVSGTTNQITSTGGTTPVLALSSTLVLPGAITINGQLNANSNKIINLSNGTAAQDAAAFGQIIYKSAPNQAHSTTDFTTTSNTYQTTNLSASITPSSSSSRVKITVSGSIGSVAVVNEYVTVARGTTDLSSGANGFAKMRNGQATNTQINVGFIVIDSPATTSSVTYNVRIKNDDNASTVHFGEDCDQWITLEEIV